MRCLKKLYTIGTNLLVGEFSDGKTKALNMDRILNLGGDLVSPLRDKKFFDKVYFEGTSIFWSNGLEMEVEDLYNEGFDYNIEKGNA